MAPPRRVRDEALTLHRTGVPDIELFRARESIYIGQYPTQGRFQVAPNAAAVAYTTPGRNELTIARRDGVMATFAGVYQDQFRMAPDGRSLSVAQYTEGSFGISRIDLRTLERISRVTMSNAPWVEFCADGLVVLEYKYTPKGTQHVLSLLPWNDEPRVVANVDTHVKRFSCAKAGKNLAYFSEGRVWSIPKAGAEAVRLAEFGYEIVNAEMSPDGRSIVVVTSKDAYLFEDGKMVESLGIPAAHTVWFSHDGNEFVVASAERAHWQRGSKKVTIGADAKSPIRTARFAPMSPWIMLVKGRDAIRWNPEQNDTAVLASADGDDELLGVDVFGGGVVLWTGSTWQLEDPKQRKFD